MGNRTGTMKDYTAGAAQAVADCRRGHLDNAALFDMDSMHGLGYRQQWNYMTRPSNQSNFPGCMETWNAAGKERALRLSGHFKGGATCTR